MSSKPSATGRLADSPLLPATFIIVFICVSQFRTFSTTPSFGSFIYVDSVSEKNWSATHSSKLSLTRVHSSALLHRKVWIIPFDEMWQIGLTDAPRDECPLALGALAKHVFSGETVQSTASNLANQLGKHRQLTALHRLGKPFLLTQGSDREVVHTFALPLQGVFPRKKRKWISQVTKPVDFVQHTSLLLNSPRDHVDARLREHLCSRERAEWMVRATSYALRQFHIKGIMPRSNPMDNAAFNDTLCCKTDVDISRDLSMCGVSCDQQGLYNILSYFPQTR